MGMQDSTESRSTEQVQLPAKQTDCLRLEVHRGSKDWHVGLTRRKAFGRRSPPLMSAAPKRSLLERGKGTYFCAPLLCHDAGSLNFMSMIQCFPCLESKLPGHRRVSHARLGQFHQD
jgi:hypothetical protein